MDFAGSRCVGLRGERSAVDHGCVVCEAGTDSDRGAGSVDGPGDQIRGTRLRMALEEAVGAIGRVEIWDDHGFLKRSRSWRRMSEALYPLVDRQKSVR